MFADTPLVMVEDAETLAKTAEALAKAPAIGVDTEGDSFFSYREKVCLLQISDLHTDYVIDPLAVSDLSPLAPIMADPNVVKIFHGADYDVVCMKRDFDFEIRNLFDTMLASQLVNLPKVGLADIIGQFFGHTIEKKYQRHDWSKRPLYPEHVDYARGDSHWLPALRTILMRRLEDVGRSHILEEECRILEERSWTPRPFDPNAFYDMKGARGLKDETFRVLRHLYVFRDAAAKKADRPVFKTISDRDLISIAKAAPTSHGELDKAISGRAGLKRRFGNGIIEAVKQAQEDDSPLPKPSKKKKSSSGGRKPPARLRGKAADRAFDVVKSWRNGLMKADPTLPHAAIVSNGTIKDIVRARPETLDELRAIDGVRNWQVEEYGEQLIELLADFTDDE